MAKSSKGKDQTALKKKATAVAAQRGNKKKKRGSMKEYFKGVKLEMKKVVWPTEEGTRIIHRSSTGYLRSFCTCILGS